MDVTVGTDPGMDALFRPRSLAVLGATERPGSVGRAVMENLLRGGYAGSIHPVNPKGGTLLGLRAFSRAAEIPPGTDAAIVMVPAPAVPGAIRECAAAGIRAAVVISAGFKECGAEGRLREEALRAAAAAGGIAVMGPNCLGLINTEIGLNAAFARRLPGPGNLSFLSQSGALGVYALEFAAANDIGIRLFASLGNKTVVDENRVLKAFGRDAGTKVILAYLEDFRDPGEFFREAGAIASGPAPKPIVLLKAGTGRSGSRAAGSHTGALAEKMDFLPDLCDQYGIVRADSLEEMFNLALCLADQPLPAGPRLAVVTNAGGPAILAADAAERRGLNLPEPGPQLRAALSQALPAAAGLANPFDVLGDAGPERFSAALSRAIAAPEFDSVLAICTPQAMTDMDGIATAIASLADEAQRAGKPLVSATARFAGPSPADRRLDDAGVPDYVFPESAALALAGAWRHRRWRDRDRSAPDAGLDAAAASAVLQRARASGRTLLSFADTQAILAACGIRTARSAFAVSEADLREAAARVGFPLVAKIASPRIIHKSDVGGVVTGIRDASELARAYASLAAIAAHAGLPLDGIALQEMVTGGVELFAGAHRHPHFGTLIGFGLGGTWVEALEDVRFRRAPLSSWDAAEMIGGIRGSALLGPFRNRPARDRKALERILLGLSALMEAFPEIGSIDLNPVLALPQGAVAVDARVLRSGPAA